MREYIDVIYRTTGIRIPEQKTSLMSNRIRRRLRATGVVDYEAYLKHLRGLNAKDPEWDAFLQEITTHETYLFRDEAQWRWFQDQFLPQVAAQAGNGDARRQLRIWSAAASTGDEAFTIAACIAHKLPNFARWSITILGTDIGLSALEEARAAVFSPRAMRLVPAEIRDKFFARVSDEGAYRAKEVLRGMVSFRQHNLLGPLAEQPFDLIFLKNVLIYFDKQSKQPVVQNIRRILRPDGYLVTGPAEGVSDLLQGMARVESWLFRNAAPPAKS
ncbi:MAG: protein-glutamate O-methyltransferase CheR [Pirellulales bacterium]|nr:protein-glutamate O-methyltransferase CheR [Pirellulales bacterium]